jgi:uncharacterized repeat protein (TIGR01451 family)
MKTLYLIFAFTFISLLKMSAQSVPPVIVWKRTLGGSGDDYAHALIKAGNNSILVGGSSKSNDGFVTGHHGSLDSTDAWVVNLTESGAVIWQKSFGGNGNEIFYGLTATNDGGYIAIGYNTLNGGDVLGNKGNKDVWVVKMNSLGDIQWQRSYGGSNNDVGYKIRQIASGGYIIVANSFSTDGDVSSNHGGGDIWVLEITSTGNIVWQKCYGGTLSDEGYDIRVTPDNGYMLAIESNSTNGDFVSKVGGFLLKINSTGVISWIKDGIPGARSVKPRSNDGFIASARNNTGSPWNSSRAMLVRDTLLVYYNSIISGYNTHNTFDPALGGFINFSDSVNIFLSNTFDLFYSPPGHNNREAHLVGGKFSSVGTRTWEKGYGGTGNDSFDDIIPLNTEGDFMVAGSTSSNDFDVSDNNGMTDFWIVKFTASNIIKGIAFFDLNKNGVKEATEPNADNSWVTTVGSRYTKSSYTNNGQFLIDVDTGTFVTSMQINKPYYTIVPVSHQTIFNNLDNSIDSIKFAVQPIPGKKDYKINLLTLTPARPGFNVTYKVQYENTGTDTLMNKQVKLVKDKRFSFLSAQPVQNIINGDTVIWNVTSLLPGDTAGIVIQLKLAVPPAANNGDTLLSRAVIDSIGDLVPSDNNSLLRQFATGSYDPNDKLSSAGTFIRKEDVVAGKSFSYIIRFQNTGTDTAFNILIHDTLDTKLDWNSIQMISASHPYQFAVKDGRYCTWTFSNIQLPDSTTNLIQSNGYIAFSIKPKSTLVANDVISNKASIYFDYNLPIVTNTTFTTVVPDVITGIRDVQNTDMKLAVAPNPNAGQSILQISGKLIGKFELKVIDNTGRIILNQALTRNNIAETLQVPVNLQQLPAGVYYIQLQQKEKMWWQKIILQ